MTASLRTQLEEALRPAYEVERELGGGGMSRVYFVMETGLGRRVVIKVLSPELTAGISAERFAREIQLSARLQQANIVPVLATGRVPVHDVVEVDGVTAVSTTGRRTTRCRSSTAPRCVRASRRGAWRPRTTLYDANRFGNADIFGLSLSGTSEALRHDSQP